MAINKNALIRYKTIDACLQRRNRKWTLDDLVEACSDAVYEYEGIHKGVSLRTVQLDIQMMRSEKLGYNAPIIVLDKKFYTYEDPIYTITKIPLTKQDLSMLDEVAQILQQFKGFSHFKEVDGMVNRLQHKVFTEKHQRRAVIDFEKNDELVGLSHIEPLFQAITQRQVLTILYQSFNSRSPTTYIFHPHLLKEYRNRWFVLGMTLRGKNPTLLALDRIKSIEPTPSVFYEENPILDPHYFTDIVGVTKSIGQMAQTVRFWVQKATVPYVLTKPLHSTQQIEEVQDDGTVFSISVGLNFELEREFLGFGETLKIISPVKLRENLENRLQKAVYLYHKSLENDG
jgi:predicted DNA-binding transcriptional regulator YafY